MPGTDLSESPKIRLFPSFGAGDVCRWLIDRARGRLSRALVYEALSKEVTVHPTRTNTAAVFNILETDLVCVLVQQRMAACLDVPFRHFEPITVLHYAEGEQITEHFDFVDPNVPDHDQEIARKGQRIATFLVYLNDDYGGGETAFPRVGVSHKAARRRPRVHQLPRRQRGRTNATRGTAAAGGREMDRFAVRPQSPAAVIQ